ncbi:hypothetical protein TTHERM_00189210 (macronuclear) [Tetrahymena thermophila SB210]|uniref:Uncharacterized protein n=1 Tax=Tetrahymena thermophila (strain SB210) TaxID=312017 RepID=I7M1H4_TETTS|nr:hypothetical protein TTHERM_00189210 [Tetrahymena thermophila SB210]EAR96352.1 hypothetical protein TTHERM_00189210 [Tetrahymena thermophila SB210]|eukprot:XP_001016597.1 hypothetical protein TTHERM_00189210 [Tetrahymena thermophila SB210]
MLKDPYIIYFFSVPQKKLINEGYKSNYLQINQSIKQINQKCEFINLVKIIN